MKGFIIVLIILLVIVTSLFFYQNALFKISDKILENISKIKDYAQNEEWEEVDREMEKLSDEWDKTSDKLFLVLDHQHLDTIMISIARAKEYKKQNETAEFMTEIANLEKLIEHISNKEKLSIKNIL